MADYVENLRYSHQKVIDAWSRRKRTSQEGSQKDFALSGTVHNKRLRRVSAFCSNRYGAKQLLAAWASNFYRAMCHRVFCFTMRRWLSESPCVTCEEFKGSHGRASRRKVVRTQLIHERRRMFVIARLTWKESSTGRKRCLLPILNTIGFRMWRAWNFYDVIIRTKGDGGSWLPGWRGRNPWLEGRGVCSQFWTPSAFGCDVHGISDVVNTISLCSYV
jgi:hypothetical protein